MLANVDKKRQIAKK